MYGIMELLHGTPKAIGMQLLTTTVRFLLIIIIPGCYLRFFGVFPGLIAIRLPLLQYSRSLLTVSHQLRVLTDLELLLVREGRRRVAVTQESAGKMDQVALRSTTKADRLAIGIHEGGHVILDTKYLLKMLVVHPTNIFNQNAYPLGASTIKNLASQHMLKVAGAV